ncbi:uncharacterized protein LOC113295883 [Papaver somniferum]|uniref:uncharacterized protein LOC113295883 n=1 Tax=Papaver somniferum TaxID=3469 RepID=UPI000E6FD035|nr:uncharacterized protein LOC113295883 [Papaver somniferum]
MKHILWQCSFNTNIWQWLLQTFNFQVPSSLSDILHFAKHKSPFVKQVWMIASCAILRELWFQKNKVIHEGISPNLECFKRRILNLVFYGGYRITGAKWRTEYDSYILHYFMLEQRNIKNSNLKECQWSNPQLGYLLFCCDGVALGDPGAAGYGVIARGCHAQVIGTISRGVGNATGFISKLLSIVFATEWALKFSAVR